MWVGIEQLHLSKPNKGHHAVAVPAALIDLIKEFGPLVPICVRPSGPRCYEIITNAETWLAAQRAGHHRVPVTVHSGLSDDDVQRIRSYADREDPISEAQRFHAELTRTSAKRQHGAITALAIRNECSASYVAHALRLLQLPDIVQEALRIGALKAGHGKTLLRVVSTEEQFRLAARVIAERWSVRKTEHHVRDKLRKRPSIDTRRLEQRLSALIGSPAKIDLEAGELKIRFGGSLDVLDGLLQRLGYVDSDS